MLRQLICLSLFLLFTLAGCIAQENDSIDYEVWGAADGAPDGCRPDQVAERLAQLSQAINEKDSALVMDFFRGGPFQWYSMGEAGTATTSERHFVAYTLNDLEGYFVERFAQDENWEMKELHVNGWESARRLVHFGPVRISRTANDLPQELGGADNLTEGKGAYHCGSATFIVLSLGMNLDE